MNCYCSCCCCFIDCVATTSNCSFPFTYSGGLYYSCIDNIENVSPDNETSACLADDRTAILCDISTGLYKPKEINSIPYKYTDDIKICCVVKYLKYKYLKYVFKIHCMYFVCKICISNR